MRLDEILEVYSTTRLPVPQLQDKDYGEYKCVYEIIISIYINNVKLTKKSSL